MTLCLHHIYVGNNIFVRGSPSARSKMEYLLLDYKRQRGGGRQIGRGRTGRIEISSTREGRGREGKEEGGRKEGCKRIKNNAQRSQGEGRRERKEIEKPVVDFYSISSR